MNKGQIFFAASLGGGIIFITLSYFYIDIPLANYCRGLDPRMRAFFGVVTELGISIWYLGASLSLFLFFRFFYKNNFWARRALFFFVAIAGSGIIVNILRFLLGRYRPEVLFAQGIYGFQFFQIESTAVSFPSGHATTAFAIATVLITFWRKEWPLFIIFALSVAASRVIITAHFLSDVIAGAYLGCLSVIYLKKWGKNYFFPDAPPSLRAGTE